MFEDHNNTVYEMVEASKLLSKAQLDELNETHLNTGKSLADAIIDSGLIDKQKLLEMTADYLNYEFMPIPPANILSPLSPLPKSRKAAMRSADFVSSPDARQTPS